MFSFNVEDSTAKVIIFLRSAAKDAFFYGINLKESDEQFILSIAFSFLLTHLHV